MTARTREVDAYNERFLSLLPGRPWVRTVQIVTEHDACEACRAQPARVPVRDLPALPHIRCMKRQGCSCWYAELFNTQ